MHFSEKIVKHNDMIITKDINYKQDTINIEGINVYYESYEWIDKEKPVVLLIHGFMSSIFSFRKLTPLLTEHFNVFAIDLPPFGKSEKSTCYTYSFSTYCNLIAAFCKCKKLKDITIIGHSLGGQIAMHTALKYPKLVQKLILLCSSGYIKRPSKKMLMASYFPLFKWYMKKRIVSTGIRGNLLNVVYDKKVVNEELEIGFAEPFLDETIFDALLVMYRKLENHLPSHEVKKIRTPVLLLWGNEDRVVPLSVGKRLEKDLMNSKLITFQNAGHLITEEIPNKIGQEIMKFTDIQS